MSNIPIRDASSSTRKVDVFTRLEGPDTVEMQAVVMVDIAGAALAQALTDAQLRATPVPVTMSNTLALTDTQLRASALPLPVGAATETTLASLNTKMPAQGQALMVASHPVVLASNQSAIAVSGNAANGAAVVGNPNLVAGFDGATVRTIRTLADGTLVINGAQDSRTAGTITSAVSVVGPVSMINRNVVTFSFSGTYAGVTINLEASDDGTQWFPLQSVDNGTGRAGVSFVLGTNQTVSYDAAVGGYVSVRVRTSTWTSGTVNVGLSPQVFAYEPVVAAISQGISANGALVLGNPALMGGSDGTNARTLSTDISGRLVVANPDMDTFTYNVAGVIAINTTLLTIDCLKFRSLMFQIASIGTTGVITTQISTDNITWVTYSATRQDGGVISNPIAGATYSLSVIARYFRFVMTTATTAGTTSLTLVSAQQSLGSPNNIQTSGSVALLIGTNRVGTFSANAIWYDDSVTVLAAAATFTGTSRDLAASATGVVITSATAFAQELRVSAESDQTGTLWVEASRDNVNWRRVKSVPTVAVAGGGFYAEIIHRPSWRYARNGFTNGATLQVRFTLGSILMAA